MIEIRDAKVSDVQGISDVYRACYGDEYAYPQYYNANSLTQMIYAEDNLMLVAEDTETNELLGTASVVYDVGAHSDLSGEFGRLAVLPEARNRGVGKMLMEERLNRVKSRLQIGLVNARVVHPFTLKISEQQGFAVVGFTPQKTLIGYRESIARMVQYFGDALELRNNHPRVIPEVYPLAHAAMSNCGIACDVIVDDEAAPYPYDDEYEIEEMRTEGYSSLLRIQRGRVRNREIFGPMKLHYGFFKLTAKKSKYLLAKQEGRIVGAVGFTHDELERVVRIFELISLDNHVIRYLLSELERRCRETMGVEYMEVDVSAYSPRMQRTLLELNFVPSAYVPALVFNEVERLDAVKMMRLLVPLDLREMFLSEQTKPIADIVIRALEFHKVAPAVAEMLMQMSLFEGLNLEQVKRLASLCAFKNYEPNATIYREGEAADSMYIVLEGNVTINFPNMEDEVGHVSVGECLSEVSLLTGSNHFATATANGPLKLAVLSYEELALLVRRRPDIGVQIYKNLAVGLCRKLKRSDMVIKKTLSTPSNAKHPVANVA